MSTSTVEALQEPTRPVGLGFQVLLGLANASAIIIPILIVLIPAQVTQIDPSNTASSLALGLMRGIRE